MEGTENVYATATYCTSSSCNKANGKTTGLQVAIETADGGDGDDNDTDGSGAVNVIINICLLFSIFVF